MSVAGRARLADLAGLPSLPPGCVVIDSHCHLDMEEFACDREEVIEHATQRGVCTMIAIGAGGPMECNRHATRLAQQHPSIFATVGLHPHDAAALDDTVWKELTSLAQREKVVGIGETGLDYHYMNSPRVAQQTAFRRHIGLAREMRRPLVVHLREADGDALRILDEEHGAENGGVIHCFSAGPESARAFLDLGFHLSFSGIITFRSAEEVRAAARLVPSDRLLAETDAPFLAPVPYRGRRNEPALVICTVLALAELRGEDPAQLTATTCANTRRLFGI